MDYNQNLFTKKITLEMFVSYFDHSISPVYSMESVSWALGL